MSGQAKKRDAPVDHEDLTYLDRVSRERWSIVAVEALIASFKPSVIIDIATKGFDEYLLHARRAYAGHAFLYEDFERMFARIKQAAEGFAKVRIH